MHQHAFDMQPQAGFGGHPAVIAGVRGPGDTAELRGASKLVYLLTQACAAGASESVLEIAGRLARTVECGDEHINGHSRRVALIASTLATEDGLDVATVFWVRIGALLHDVGKLRLPGEMLTKCGALTPDEWTLMRRHPALGDAMLGQRALPSAVRSAVAAHHEWWNGLGYPYGLAGEAIPYVARIVSLADVYDALTSERSYKPAMPHRAALQVMRRDVGRQFDPRLFASFERVAARHSRAWASGSGGRRRPPTS
jgi:putative nucleotidyltransferase with HDIG domain